MPIEIPDTCEFELPNDKMEVQTRANGDRIQMYPVLNQDTAAIAAYLANHPNCLVVEIRVKGC